MYTTTGQDMRGHTSSEALRLTTHTVQLCSNEKGSLCRKHLQTIRSQKDYSIWLAIGLLEPRPPNTRC